MSAGVSGAPIVDSLTRSDWWWCPLSFLSSQSPQLTWSSQRVLSASCPWRNRPSSQLSSCRCQMSVSFVRHPKLALSVAGEKIFRHAVNRCRQAANAQNREQRALIALDLHAGGGLARTQHGERRVFQGPPGGLHGPAAPSGHRRISSANSRMTSESPM